MYQAASPSVSGTTGAHRRRTVNVCARCHKRKRKCDRKFPSCSGCAQAGVECTGLNPSRNGDAPRSIVQFLEQSITQLEKSLAIPSSLSTSPQSKILDTFSDTHERQKYAADDTNNRKDEALYKTAVMVARNSGIATTNTIIESCEGLPYKGAMLLSTELPLPLTDLQRDNEIVEKTSKEFGARDSVRLPYDVAKRLFEVFVDKILIQNPIFFEDDLRAHFNAVYHNTDSQPSDVSIFMVSMVLAISTMTSKAYNFSKIVSLSESLHREALKYCEFLSVPGIVALQGILLLMQFAELLPSTGSLWHLAGEAVSLALQLGLHQDPHEGANLDFVALDLRRRIFWTVYCMERSITVTSHRRFILKDEHINVEFPTEYEDSYIKYDGITPGGRRTKLHFLNYIRFRQIQSEILAVQFFDRPFSFPTYEAWAYNIDKRLQAWQQSALSQSETPPDWFPHAVWQCYLMLHRPCPRNKKPTEQSMINCVEAAMGLSKGTWELLQTGYLTYPFHNAHNGFEATTVVLYGLKNHARMMHNRYGNQDVVGLIEQLSGLFGLLSERWPAAASIGDFLRGMKQSTISEFLSISNTSSVPKSLQQPDQLELIVLHQTAESTPGTQLAILEKDQQEAQDVGFDIPPFSRYESWPGTSPQSESNFTSVNFHNLSRKGSRFGDVNWVQSTASHEFDGSDIKVEYAPQGWMEDQSTVSSSQSPPKDGQAFGIDFEILRSTTKLLPSCNRCRTRRIKCERDVLDCQNCIDSGSVCIYKDKLLSRDIPCHYISSLQQRLHSLLNNNEQPQPPTATSTTLMPYIATQNPLNSTHVHVRAHADDENTLTRTMSALTLDKSSCADTTFFGYTSAISQLTEQPSHATSCQKEQQNWPKSAHKGLKVISKQIFNQEPGLPPISTTMQLIEVFKSSINVLYHIIDHAKLDQICTAAYDPSKQQNFFDRQTLQLIVAISLQILSKEDPSLSASSVAYFRDSTRPCKPSGSASVVKYSLKSLRSTLLVCVYLLLSPQAGDVWRMVAFASRICFDIGNMSKRDTSEHQAYFLLYQSLHCIDCNVSIAFGRPSQLPERPGPLTNLLPKGSSAPLGGRIASYYHNLTRIKSHLHNALMTKHSNLEKGQQTIQSTIEECRAHLDEWSTAWNAEVDSSQRIYTGESILADFKRWGSVLYYETYLFLQRYSSPPSALDERLAAINGLAQNLHELRQESATAISSYLADTQNNVALNFFPCTWTFAHTVLSASLDFAKLRNHIEIQDVAFRSCITLLGYLERDRDNLLGGFTQELESLYGLRDGMV